MPRTIAILGCLDTKGEELRFLRRVIEGEGACVHLMDTGILGDGAASTPPRAGSASESAAPEHTASASETDAEAVAAAAGTTLEALRASGDRGAAVAAMSVGAARLVRELYDNGSIHGVIGAGGSANTTICSSAMQVLPVGFPKVLVSTLASGNVAPYVDTKDITLMYSVVDIAGLNRISTRILANAARAVTAMASGGEDVADSRPVVAATMFGVTTPCVTAARRRLEAAGYEVVVFHATGSGGRAMEGLIMDGHIDGVLDLTTTELADELVGGILSAGEHRLTAAARAGVPQVVSIGAIDMVNFGPRDSVPEAFAERLFYEHNPTVTLMRTTAEECSEIGRRIAERVRNAAAPTRVLLPLAGVSSISERGEVFYDPGADGGAIEAIQAGLDGSAVSVERVDAAINDEAFAQRCADSLLELMGAPS